MDLIAPKRAVIILYAVVAARSPTEHKHNLRAFKTVDQPYFELHRVFKFPYFKADKM